jgi:hypothetical protein
MHSTEVNTWALYKSVGKKEAIGSATPSGRHLGKHVGFLNSWNLCWALPIDGIVKFNEPHSQFLVNRAFWIIQCWILKLLLYVFWHLKEEIETLTLMCAGGMQQWTDRIWTQA